MLDSAKATTAIMIPQMLQALLAVFRAVWVMNEHPSTDLFENNRLQVIWFSQAILFVNLTFLGLTMMITQRPRLELDRQVSFDLLTGALNREGLAAAAGGDPAPAGVIVADLDHFKSINDSFGHGIGDTVLQVFAETAAAKLGPYDMIGRLGGEEFAIVLYDAGRDRALAVAERKGADDEADRGACCDGRRCFPGRLR